MHGMLERLYDGFARSSMKRHLKRGVEKYGKYANPLPYALPMLSYFNNHLAIASTGIATRMKRFSNGKGSMYDKAARAMLTTPAIIAGMRMGYALSDMISSGNNKLLDAVLSVIGYAAMSMLVERAEKTEIAGKAEEAVKNLYSQYRHMVEGLGKHEIIALGILAIPTAIAALPYVKELNDFLSGGESMYLLNLMSSYTTSASALSGIAGFAKRKIQETQAKRKTR